MDPDGFGLADPGISRRDRWTKGNAADKIERRVGANPGV